MTLEIFLMLLLGVSLLTGLCTEGLKKIFTEANKSYRANLIAGFCSVFLSVLVSIGYTILANIPFDAKLVVYIIALIFTSWLSAMVGYDKVKQTILQVIAAKQKP